MASESGTMYNTAAMLAAIWCAAEASVPWRAMNKAISVNEVTSTVTASAEGIPSRAKAASCARLGGSMRCHTCKGAYIACVRSSHRATASMPQFTTRVAQPQPTTPIAGMPAPPNVHQMDSGILTSSEITCNQVTHCGCPRAWLSVLNTRNSRAGGSARASTARYCSTLGRRASGTWVQANTGSGCNSTAMPGTQARAQRYSDWRSEPPMACGLRAPRSSAQMGSSALSMPSRGTYTLMYRAELIANAASDSCAWRPATMVSVT